MKLTKFFFYPLLIVMMLACKSEPVPIQYGSDNCIRCHMTIVESRFGAEIVTKKGKVFTFDSIECMLRYYKTNAAKSETFAHIMVTDALHPGKLIDARSAFYLVSEKYPSPMGENLSAYASKAARDGNHAEFSGEQLTWESLTKRYSI